MYYYLDNYTRGKDRVELIRSIKDARVHVFGETSQDNAVGILGWKQYLAGQKNVTINPSIPFGAAMHVMRKSKIILNSMPFFKNGTHERVLAGLACGAVPVTTENLFFREIFKDGEDILFYQMDKREDVNAKINQLLADESKREAMARRGAEKVKAGHTWDIRVEQLLTELPAIFDRIRAKTIKPDSNSPMSH